MTAFSETQINTCNREGGTCYLKCEGRTVLQNITSGALGSYEGEGIQYGYAHCLWILTVFPDVTTIKSKKQTENAPIILFTIEKDIKTECDKASTLSYYFQQFEPMVVYVLRNIIFYGLT